MTSELTDLDDVAALELRDRSRRDSSNSVPERAEPIGAALQPVIVARRLEFRFETLRQVVVDRLVGDEVRFDPFDRYAVSFQFVPGLDPSSTTDVVVG